MPQASFPAGEDVEAYPKRSKGAPLFGVRHKPPVNPFSLSPEPYYGKKKVSIGHKEKKTAIAPRGRKLKAP